MLVNGSLSQKNMDLEGLTMDRVLALRAPAAKNRASPPPDPLDVLLDLLREEKGSISTIYAHHTEEDMNLALVQPWCSVGSDGLAHATQGPLRRGRPHPRSFGTFPRVLGVYVRERRLLGLKDAVRKMTSLNAAKLGIADRGLLRAGDHADITVFDPGRAIDKATYLDPFQYPEGIEFVAVNGRITLERGTHTGARAGRALRRRRWSSTRLREACFDHCSGSRPPVRVSLPPLPDSPSECPATPTAAECLLRVKVFWRYPLRW